MSANMLNVLGLDSSSSFIAINSDMLDVTPNPAVIKIVVDWQLAKRRAGTHSTKTIGCVSGTGAKPYKQKKTGRARHGTLRSAQFRGGAIIFGPHYRSHGYSVNSKVRTLALRMAVADKYKNGDFVVVDKFVAGDHKTKTVKKITDGIHNSRGSILCVYGSDGLDASFRLGSRNLPNVNILPICGLNVYDVVRSKKVVIDIAGVKALEARFGFSEVVCND